MAIVNSCQWIHGFIGQTIDSFQTGKNSKPYVKFSISETRTFKDEKTVEWFQITVFGPLAEALVRQKRIVKGYQCLAVGVQKTSRWKDKNGNEKVSVETIATIVVSNEKLLFSRAALDGAAEARQIDQEIGDDDVPF